MKDSTKKMSKMFGSGEAERTVHLYLYARYLPHYIYKLGGPVGLVDRPPPDDIPPEVEEMLEILAHRVARELNSAETSTYHAKVVPLKDAEQLVTVEEDIELTDLDKVIPFEIARDIVMVNPQKIALVDCACRTLSDEPCEPVDVCMVVGDPFASFVVEHGVMNARWITAEEAVDILKREDERGHVHNAFFKDVVGGRFYAICNCCSCCCLGMKAWNTAGVPILAPSGYVARVGEECTACGDCEEICPFGAVRLDEAAVVDENKCMGCGVCEGACEFGAIRLELEPSKGEPLDIKKLVEESEGGKD